MPERLRISLNLSSASHWEWCRVEKSSEIRDTPRLDATPEAELDTLASVYRFILFESRSANKKAAELAQAGTGKDAKNLIRRKEAGMT
jgi:hypothetical protein